MPLLPDAQPFHVTVNRLGEDMPAFAYAMRVMRPSHQAMRKYWSRRVTPNGQCVDHAEHREKNAENESVAVDGRRHRADF
jgi:hypothetical protein